LSYRGLYVSPKRGVTSSRQVAIKSTIYSQPSRLRD